MSECWKENFRIFYESNSNMVNSRIETKCLNVNVPEKIMKNKVINTIRMLKNNKVAGVDCINGEISKTCGLFME